MPIAIEVTAEPIEVMAEPIEVTAGGTLDLQDQCERNPLCLRGFRHHLQTVRAVEVHGEAARAPAEAFP